VYSTHHYDDSYQSLPRHHLVPKNHTHSTKPKINLPSFYRNKNVEEYLDWKMKVEKLFECHQVDEKRKVSMATLSFQEYAMY